nr:PREDICTED: serine/threonine-protein kinase haspin [Paralichthys olivaceus]
MKPVKSLFLKTYGKQRRKLPAWISPEDRKQAFDSTDTTDGDNSVFEPKKPARIRERNTSVASRRGARLAKKKAMLCLTEKTGDEDHFNNEENFVIPSPPCPPVPQQSKTTRGKKTRGCSGRVHPAKRNAVLSLSENSSDEENIGRPSSQCPQPAQQSKTTRKSQLTSVPGVFIRQKRKQVPVTSESEEDSRVHHRSVGRFVTRRKGGAVVKPKLLKEIVSILNSSDDFTSGAFCSKGTRQRTRRRKVPPVVSSTENSMNAAGSFSFATNPLREISLNESADRSVGLFPRNPIFCSTPSAGSFSKHPHLKPLPINDKSSSPPSMSVSCTGVLSTFQEDLNSPEPHPARPTGLHSEGKLLSSLGEQVPHLHHHEELSGDLLMEHTSTNKRSSCSKEAKSYSENSKTRNGDELSSLNPLSSDIENSCEFVSAAGGLEWLIEALKEQCLTNPCTVQLERLDILTMTQLCSQTTYSSCLGLLSSDDDPPSVESSQTTSFHFHLSVTDDKTGDRLQLINSFESPGQAVTVTDTSSVACKQSSECSSASVFNDESTHHTESSVEFIMGTQLGASGPVKTLFTEEKAAAVKDKCLAKTCTIQLKRLSLPQITKLEESPFTCNNRSGSLDATKSENDYTLNIDDPEDLVCSGDTTEGMTVSDRQSTNNSSCPVAHTQSSDPETEEKAVVISTLKEKCLSDKPTVEMKKLTLAQLRHKKCKSTSVMSDPASDEQIKKDHQSVRKKWSSTSSEDKISSDKEVVKSSCEVLPKRKKLSLAPRDKKRRSTSTDQPGTMRKACVSGLSVSRWKNKSSTHTRAGDVKPVDCSINELISTKHKQQREHGTVMNFSTPVRANPLNLSSLLADFTPNTHTWSRLKAALSVHRKVLLTPRSSHLSGSPGRTALADLSQDLFATPFRTLLPKHLQSQLCHDSPGVCEDADLSDAEKVYAECGQKLPLPWEDCILPHRMKRCVKIGEGTFGEVFSTTNASGDTVALKIIPVEGSEKVNGETQKIFGEILHEIIISKELSSLKEKETNQTHSFIGLNDLHCVRGCYPPDFLNAWDKFDQRKGSENDRPDFFEKDQLFLILEFEFGGVDLENSNGTLASLGVAKSILHQVTAALAVAEEELHFEHRDLHWGNVLVKTTKQKTGSFLLNGTAHSLETKGVLVRIIDYSLSRLEIDDLTVSCDISKDEELFMGQGDYQFDIYRLMRQENGNNWGDYHPHTNVLWLHYLCSKLLSMKYRSSGGRGAKDIRAELTRFYDNVLQYSSATEALQNCPMFQ